MRTCYRLVHDASSFNQVSKAEILQTIQQEEKIQQVGFQCDGGKENEESS